MGFAAYEISGLRLRYSAPLGLLKAIHIMNWAAE